MAASIEGGFGAELLLSKLSIPARESRLIAVNEALKEWLATGVTDPATRSFRITLSLEPDVNAKIAPGDYEIDIRSEQITDFRARSSTR